ncbi:glycosyltransferase family 2 protein [Muricoccus aerilatus]|uniref:glycosyltransferase family 2 protein n=1 Tax=Muricoccus aerilatus TaxID=452982 RepID=UPI0009FB9588|nr:glycosyltransferase family A protein [Roseomonas aerilata]
MPPEPSISVVIPTWNRADLLPETLDCVLAQDNPAAEIIVVDDGSEDGTQALLDRYKSRGVKNIRISNSGDLHARNVGLEAAKSTLVAFCDSDDLWKSTFLRMMVDCWNREARTCAVYADFQIVRDGVWETSTKFDLAPTGFWDGLRPVSEGLFMFDRPMADRLVSYQPFFPSALVANREFLLEIGGWDEGTSGLVGRDFATAIRIAEHAPLGILRQPLVGIRKHTSNDSGDTLAMNLGDGKVLEHILRTRPAMAPYAAAIKASIIDRRRRALDLAFTRGNFSLVRDIAELLPPEAVSRLTQLKCLAARLPDPLRRISARGLMAAGTLKSRLQDSRSR